MGRRVANESKEYEARWRVLAIDPTRTGFAFAVLEGRNRLIDWGLKRAPNRDLFDSRVAKLYTRYQPDLVALEKELGSRRRGRSIERITRALNVAAEHHIATCKVARRQVHDTLGAVTKHAVAKNITRRFPVLTPNLPRSRRPWAKEDERMSIFNAISFALTVQKRL